MKLKKIGKITFGITAFAVIISSAVSAFADSAFDKHQEMYRLRAEGNYLECIALADSLIAENPYDISSYTNKALAAYQYGDFRTSYDTFEKQLSLNPYNQIALYNKACLASVITDYETVIQSLKLILSMDISAKKLIKQDSDFINCYENESVVNMLFDPSIRVCGTLLDPTASPINENGRLLVPIRPVIEAMGATVEWNQDDKSFAVIMDGKTLIMQVGSNTAKLNGTAMEIETAPVIKNDSSYVPIRFIAEKMGFEVEWDAELGLADIYTHIPEGNFSLADFKAANDSKIDNLIICGLYIEPYLLDADKGIIMLAADNASVIDDFNRLSISDKSEYLMSAAIESTKNLVPNNYSSITVKLISDSKTFYSMDYSLADGICGKLRYFKNGLLTNVIKQLNTEDNYVDYYQWKKRG